MYLAQRRFYYHIRRQTFFFLHNKKQLFWDCLVSEIDIYWKIYLRTYIIHTNTSVTIFRLLEYISVIKEYLYVMCWKMLYGNKICFAQNFDTCCIPYLHEVKWLEPLIKPIKTWLWNLKSSKEKSKFFINIYAIYPSLLCRDAIFEVSISEHFEQ